MLWGSLSWGSALADDPPSGAAHGHRCPEPDPPPNPLPASPPNFFKDTER
jgi:hypothetical protein